MPRKFFGVFMYNDDDALKRSGGIEKKGGSLLSGNCSHERMKNAFVKIPIEHELN